MRIDYLPSDNDTDFYPTPDDLAGKMLSGVDWTMINNILEPSAGKGNLAKCAIKANGSNHRRGDRKFEIDCIEIDRHLRSALKYEFSDEAISSIKDRYRELDRKLYSDRTPAETADMNRLSREIEIFNSASVRIVHDDFLTFSTPKQYSLILMNPPFSNGDEHLLKALELQKTGGSIICLLNAETLKNPCTNKRRLLAQKLDECGAQITYIPDAFKHAERKTGVEVALIRANIPYAKQSSFFYESMKEAQRYREPEVTVTDMTVSDLLKSIICQYDVEVAASVKLINEYHALKPYMAHTFGDAHASAILTLTVGCDENYLQDCRINDYLREVRLKYWRALFSREEFTGKLTSNLQQKYRGMVDRLADYDFTMFNIQSIFAEMNGEMVKGVRETILELFDKLSYEHSWYPETKQNRHYFDGWKTNSAHKVNKKVIIPTRGMFSDYNWHKTAFEVSEAYNVIGDIEKAFNYLDGGMTADVDLKSVLQAAAEGGQTRNIPCKYFDVDLYKKGTTHIKFRNLELLEKLNIYAAREKRWLPPNYGKSKYKDMAAEERKVVDEFQGAEAYEKVMRNTGYYLVETSQMALLPGVMGEAG